MSGNQYALGPDQAPSEGVVRAIAETEDVPSTAVEPPLYEAIDPEALDGLVGTTDGDREGSVAVQFRYAGYEVSVDATGPARIHLVESD